MGIAHEPKDLIFYALVVILTWLFVTEGMTRKNKYMASGLCWLFCFFALATSCRAGGGGSHRVLFQVFLGIGAGVVGTKLYHSAQNHLEILKQELELEREIEFDRNQLTKEQVRTTQIVSEAESELAYAYVEMAVARLSLQTAQVGLITAQKEFELQQQLIEIGKLQGLSMNAVSGINEQKYRAEIDLEKRWKEIAQDLDAGDLLDLADDQLIDKQTERLENMFRKKYNTANSDDPDEVKNQILARLDKNIQNLEAKIDARQKLVLPADERKESRRLTEGKADSRTDYPPETDEDTD